MYTRLFCTNRMILTATDNTSGVIYRTDFGGRCIDLEEALEKAEELFEFCCCDHAEIINAETGELFAICEDFIAPKDEPNEEEEERFGEYMNEMGFDPYSGDYTWDC